MDRRQSIFCVFNLTGAPQHLPLSQINLIWGEPWVELLSGAVIDVGDEETLELAPYQAVWITNMTAAH